MQVEVLEEKGVVGGACKTEYPFPKAPGLRQSTGEQDTRPTGSGAPDPVCGALGVTPCVMP